MTALRRTLQSVLVSLTIIIPAFAPHHAAAETAPFTETQGKTPDSGAAKDEAVPETKAALSNLLDPEAKVYFLGNRSGLDGWLIFKDNKLQVAYTTQDRKTVIFGGMFGPDGYNVTGDQVQALSRSNQAVGAELTAIYKKEAGLNGGTESDSSLFPEANQANYTTNATLNAVFPPSERLLLDLQEAAGVDIGDPKAPMIYMIMDPNCPHCQATWKALRDAVFKNALRIHLVPIGRNEEEERAAARLLHVADPLNIWDKYVAGDKTQLAGDADKKLIQAVEANHVLVDKWSVKETPFLLYRSKDGKIKVLAGEPKHPETLVGDVGP